MRIAICDDNKTVAEKLSKDVIGVLGLSDTKVDVFYDSDALLFSVGRTPYDIVFMDIELGGVSGIRFSEKLLAQIPDLQIIFISGYDDYYLDVYDVPHIYFLRKPIEKEKLKDALDSACRNKSVRRNRYLDITNRRNIFRIPVRNILFMEKSGRQVCVHTADGETYRTYGKFTDPQFSALLEDAGWPFFQCHNSFVVNFHYALALSDRKFVMGTSCPEHKSKEKHEVPISKSFYPKVRDAFAAFLNG